MSDHLLNWIHHTQPNVHGGQDLFDSHGARIGSTMPAVDGGEDVYDAHGGHAYHVQGNVHGGHDLTDAHGHMLAHGFHAAGGGEDVYGADGQHLQHIQHDHGQTTIQDAHGHFETWHSNIFGGMTADPLSNMRAIDFPPFGF